MIVFLLPLLGQGPALGIWTSGEKERGAGREEMREECGAGALGDREVVPVSSRFWVRSAGQELLVTPTREAVTWGSPLYTFRRLLDRGNCGVRWGEGCGEQPPLQGDPCPGPIIPRTPRGSRTGSPTPHFEPESPHSQLEDVRIHPGPLRPTIPWESP